MNFILEQTCKNVKFSHLNLKSLKYKYGIKLKK